MRIFKKEDGARAWEVEKNGQAEEDLEKRGCAHALDVFEKRDGEEDDKGDDGDGVGCGGEASLGDVLGSPEAENGGLDADVGKVENLSPSVSLR